MNKLTANNEEILAKLAKNRWRYNWPMIALFAAGVAFWVAVLWVAL